MNIQPFPSSSRGRPPARPASPSATSVSGSSIFDRNRNSFLADGPDADAISLRTNITDEERGVSPSPSLNMPRSGAPSRGKRKRLSKVGALLTSLLAGLTLPRPAIRATRASGAVTEQVCDRRLARSTCLTPFFFSALRKLRLCGKAMRLHRCQRPCRAPASQPGGARGRTRSAPEPPAQALGLGRPSHAW